MEGVRDTRKRERGVEKSGGEFRKMKQTLHSGSKIGDFHYFSFFSVYGLCYVDTRGGNLISIKENNKNKK